MHGATRNQRVARDRCFFLDFGETPFIYGENFAALLKKRIALMRKHRRDAPRIDPEFMFRIPNNPYA